MQLVAGGYRIDFILHMSVPVSLCFALTITFCKMVYFSDECTQFAKHLSGPKLFTGKQAYLHAAKQLRADLAGGKHVGVSVHPKVTVSLEAETGNLVVMGQHGSGKSNLLKLLLLQIQSRGDKLLVFDDKPEYLKFLFDHKEAALICAPDERSRTWTIAVDADTPETALMVVSQLIHTDSADPLWTDGARLVLASCICTLNATLKTAWGWPELSDALTWNHETLIRNIQEYYPAASKTVVEGSRTTEGFLVTLTLRLSWVHTLARLWPDRTHNPFSIKEWVNGESPYKIIIIPNRSEYSALSKPLCAVFLSLMTAHVLSLPDSRTRRIWFCLDEFASLPKTPAISDWLSKGRSKGARTLAGFQSFSQLEDIYGEKMAETLVSLFTNVAVLRCGSGGSSARKAAGIFGVRQVERPVVTVNSVGESSTTYQRQEEPLVRAEDLIHLPQATRHGIEGYICLGGTNSVYRLRWPHPSITNIAEEFVPSKRLVGQFNIKTNRRRKRNS
tara:strand:- start:88 stop:1596 length:1509 start_codon:yes stop_codon:yes gene_type:complete